MTSSTACPTCGADGVAACVGLDGADHEGRPPYFDAQATAALDPRLSGLTDTVDE